MADNTSIEWTDATWPVVAGCTRVSPGCDNCYAVRDSWRLAHNPNPKCKAVYEGTVGRDAAGLEWSGLVRSLPDRLEWPLHWRKPRRIFVCNMSDLFHLMVPSRFRCAVFGIMAATPQHTYQLLTKGKDEALEWFKYVDRLAEESAAVFPDETLNWRRWHVLRAAAIYFTGRPLPSIPVDPPWPLPNVQVGVTAENQEQADRRIPLLLQMPAAVRFVSVEPMLGPVDLSGYLAARNCTMEPDGCQYLDNFYPAPYRCDKTECASWQGGLHWIIVGGETGPGARPMHPDWARSVRDQCQLAATPFFFKQWGAWAPVGEGGWYSKEKHFIRGKAFEKVPYFSDPKGRTPEPADHPVQPMQRVGKARAGQLLDGQEWHQFPEVKIHESA